MRADFPEPVRDALDVMEDREHGRLLRDITASSQAHGFMATIRACRVIVESGREPSFTSIDQTAGRAAQGDDEPHGPGSVPLRPIHEEDTHMSTTIVATTRRPRGGRTVGKATIGEVMDLSRNLPRSVARPGQPSRMPRPAGRALPAGLSGAENAGRERSRRPGPPEHAVLARARELDGYDWSMTGFPQDRGGNGLPALDFIDRAEDLVLYGDVGCGRIHPVIAIGGRACGSDIPVGFLTAAGPVMGLGESQGRETPRP